MGTFNVKKLHQFEYPNKELFKRCGNDKADPHFHEIELSTVYRHIQSCIDVISDYIITDDKDGITKPSYTDCAVTAEYLVVVQAFAEPEGNGKYKFDIYVTYQFDMGTLRDIVL